MSWMWQLYETYENILKSDLQDKENILLPICHTTVVAHVEVILDELGNFVTAKVIDKADRTTIIPCTENSETRSGSKPKPHPLMDKLQYLAGDFVERGGEVTSGFKSDPMHPYKEYQENLGKWYAFDKNQKLNAVLCYINKGVLSRDLIQAGILPIEEDGKFSKVFNKSIKEKYLVFSRLLGQELPEDIVIRWQVEIPGNEQTALWKDKSLWQSWINFCKHTQTKKSLCMVTGDVQAIADKHPAKIRNSGDKAKIISSNDSAGYTFRGTFADSQQACEIGFETTQKAHNALRWLINKQGYKNGDQIFVAWAVSGNNIPHPFESTLSLFDESFDSKEQVFGDLGQMFALKLNKLMAGYSTKISSIENIVVLGLDSAVPGRMGITYYQEIKGSDFLARINTWHHDFSWELEFTKYDNEKGKNKSKSFWCVSAPSLKEVVDAAYGVKADAKLKKATVERIVPCVLEGRNIPHDILDALLQRVSHRMALESWEWNRVLAIACAIYKGYYLRCPGNSNQRSEEMALDEKRSSRDYLYGRLLAIADHMEGYALYLASEKRDTQAARLTQRFAQNPYETWANIELSLQPYKARIRAKSPGYLNDLVEKITQVCNLFKPEDFISTKKLTGEFLLGYYCQRYELKNRQVTEKTDNPE